MGAVNDAIEEGIKDTYEAIEQAVADVWDEVVRPLLEDILALFGIEDEDIVITQKISSMLYGENTIDVVQQANVKAVISMAKVGGSFFQWQTNYTQITKVQIAQFYRFAEQGRYLHQLPSLEIRGGDVDYAAIDSALNTDLGFPATRIFMNTLFPGEEIYFKDQFQEVPYNYIPHANTLTFTDPYGVSRTDYTWGSIVYVAGNNTYDIAVSRVAEQTLFWIEGPVHTVEGDSITYTIKCNRTVPAGESVTVNLEYGGTAPGYGYTAVPTAIITAGNTEVDIVIATYDDISELGSKILIVTVDSITNTNAAFESVGVHSQNSASTTITDNEGIILTMSSHIATEASGSVTIPVKLEEATVGPFTVDYAMANGTAFGGIDFDNTPGTLSFAGTKDEVQNITITIYPDAPDDDEYFTVYFTARSDPAVDITYSSVVTITDSSSTGPVPGTINLNDIITVPGYVKEKSIVITYHANTDPNTEWFYWVYKFSDNTYAGLDSSMQTLSEMEMLPIAILRRDKISIDSDKTTQEYKSTRNLLKILSFNIDEIITTAEENPDISKITDMFLNFAVCPSSTVEVVSKILWLSYYNIVVVHNLTSTTDEFVATFKEQGIENAVAWSSHTYTAGLSGTLANGGEHDHGIVITPEEVDEDGETTQESGSELWIRYQTSAGIYSELKVYNLNAMASIAHGGFSKVALNKIGDLDFTIPLSNYIINQMTPTEKMVLFQHILRIDAYAIDVIHLEFYETQWFSRVFEFAMIVITMWTLGTSSGAAQFFRQLVTNYLILEMVIYLAELTGNAEFAAIVGLVAMIVLNDTGGTPLFDFSTAEGLIQASTNFADNLTAGYNTLSEGLQDDLRELNEKAEVRLEEIKEAQPEEIAITPEFLTALNSVETTVFPAIKAQYDFELIYNYDRLIADYYDLNLRTGVT